MVISYGRSDSQCYSSGRHTIGCGKMDDWGDLRVLPFRLLACQPVYVLPSSCPEHRSRNYLPIGQQVSGGSALL